MRDGDAARLLVRRRMAAGRWAPVPPPGIFRPGSTRKNTPKTAADRSHPSAGPHA